MTMETIVGTAVAAGGAGVLGAIVNGIVNRRKLGADATEAISRAAGSMVSRLEEDNARLRAEREADHIAIRELQRTVDGLVSGAADREAWFMLYQEALRNMFAVHMAYDERIIARLKEASVVDVPKPPTLEIPVITDEQVNAASRRGRSRL